MKKFLSLLLVFVMLITMTLGCAKNETNNLQNEEEKEEEEETTAQASSPIIGYTESDSVRLGALKGVTTMGMVKLLSDAEQGVSANKYDFTMATTADELTGPFLMGKFDILAVPANLASILNNKSEGKVQMLAVNMLGGLFILQKGEQTISSITDLKGKTIYATGKGNTPEYVLSYILSRNGLLLGTDVTVEWYDEPSEVVADMTNEVNAIAMLPQPFMVVAQSKVDGLNVVLNLEDEWNKTETNSKYVTACLIARREFVEAHPDMLATFMEEYKASTEFVKTNVTEAANLIEAYDIVKASIAEKALPQCNICCITGDEMKNIVNGYYNNIFVINAKSVGGALPGDDFYYIAE